MNSDPFYEKRIAFEKDADKNVFIIMRYCKDVPFSEIETTIKKTLQRFGLKGILARDIELDQDQLIWNNVRFCMDHSRYAIVIFESILTPYFNPNVALELGYMLALKRPCLILKEQSLPTLNTDITGHLYKQFKSHMVKETVGVAIEEWLKKLGHSCIKPTETIKADTDIEALKNRTKKIITELSDIDSTRCIVRQAASLSSLAITDNEHHKGDDDGEYQKLLLEERDLFSSLLKSGNKIRLIISPETLVNRIRLKAPSREYVEINVLPRFERLISTIKENLTKESLEIVYAVRLPHDNLLIVGDSRAFIGRKRTRERGFPHTTLVYDPAVIYGEIQEFDALFHDSVGVILGIGTPNSSDYGSEELKQKVISHLKEFQKEIKRLLDLPPFGNSG